MIYLSPLFGSLIATILMLIYAAIESSLKWSELFNLATVFPITFLFFSIISYILSFTIGAFLVKKKQERLWSEGFFMFMCALCGTFLGLVFSIIILNMGTTLLKVAFIFTSFFLGSTFTSSFYIGLERELNKSK